jgi:hypothetical protein
VVEHRHTVQQKVQHRMADFVRSRFPLRVCHQQIAARISPKVAAGSYERFRVDRKRAVARRAQDFTDVSRFEQGGLAERVIQLARLPFVSGLGALIDFFKVRLLIPGR